jgi:alpha-mannosidase
MTHTLTVVSHTHWDREWHQPFQEFRIRGALLRPTCQRRRITTDREIHDEANA